MKEYATRDNATSVKIYTKSQKNSNTTSHCNTCEPKSNEQFLHYRF